MQSRSLNVAGEKKHSRLRSVVAAVGLVVMGSAGLVGLSGAASAQTQLLNVSYDPTRELYREINQAFAEEWKAQTGETVNVRASHAGSGAQARAVIDGIDADVVTLGIPSDIDAIVKASAPSLVPKTWYGMPAYAKDGKVLCFFQGAHKFNARYATFGFNDPANLDEGAMWATSFALKELTDAEEAKIAALVKKAVS